MNTSIHSSSGVENENRLRARIREARGNVGLPEFSGPWEQVNQVGDWRVYIVHDPCHDNDNGFVDDRNTVIALSNTRGTWRILGRELPREFSLEIAEGRV